MFVRFHLSDGSVRSYDNFPWHCEKSLNLIQSFIIFPYVNGILLKAAMLIGSYFRLRNSVEEAQRLECVYELLAMLAIL